MRDAGGGAGSPGYEVAVPVFPISFPSSSLVAGLRVLPAAGRWLLEEAIDRSN